MVRDRVDGWRAIERIDVALVRPARPAVLGVSRWLSPSGIEATVVTTWSIGRDDEADPSTVSAPTVARDAGLAVGEFVVDPQLHWLDVDGRHLLVSPVLGVRVSVRSAAAPVGTTRTSHRLRLVRIEPLAAGVCPSADAPERAVPLEGTHPALWSRWPVPVTNSPEAAPAQAVHPAQAVRPAHAIRPARLAAPPPGFSRTPGHFWDMDQEMVLHSASGHRTGAHRHDPCRWDGPIGGTAGVDPVDPLPV